jgi:urease accessory protein
VMERDARRMRGAGPFVFAQATHGLGLDAVEETVVHAYLHATGHPH